MTISIKIFQIFDKIREKYDIGVTEWAEHSNIPQPRISELRRLVKSDDSSSVGRAFSFEKCLSLANGLRAAIGGEILSKELLERVDDLTEAKDRNIILVLALDDDKQSALEIYIRTLMNVKSDSPKKDKKLK